jgi:phosphatidylserine decarboxylase
MPYDGKLIAMDYIPGDLFSVNQNSIMVKILVSENFLAESEWCFTK